MNLPAVLSEAIGGLSQTFAVGELAFLALTSKVERPFLDRLSFQLHLQLASEGGIVAREYPVAGTVRADIAILKDGTLIGAVEGKAMYTADCAGKPTVELQHPLLLEADLRRYMSVSHQRLEVFSLLLATHPKAGVPSTLRSVLKYSPLVNRAFKTHGTCDEIERVAEERLTATLRPEMRLRSGKLAAGTAYGVPVELLWWLYGPFDGKAGWTILRTGAA